MEPSEVALIEAMSLVRDGARHRRSNPPADALVVSYLLPEPGQAWVELATVFDEGTARDEAMHPSVARPLPSGTAMRIARGGDLTWSAAKRSGELAWLGVVRDDGAVIEAPPVPRKTLAIGGPRPEGDWLQVWDLTAPADWMLSACAHVDPREVVRACSIMFREVAPDLDGTSLASDVKKAQRAVDRWLSKGTPIEDGRELAATLRDNAMLFLDATPSPRLDAWIFDRENATAVSELRARRASSSTAMSCIVSAAIDTEARELAFHATVGARSLGSTERDGPGPKLAAVVRRSIPVGVVIAAQLRRTRKVWRGGSLEARVPRARA